MATDQHPNADLVRCWFCNSDTPPGTCTHCGLSTTKPHPIAESVAAWKTGDLVTDPETGMVGRVTDHWDDDGGQWINIEWFPSTVRGNEVVEPTPEDRRTHES